MGTKRETKRAESVTVQQSSRPGYPWRVKYPGADGKRASRFFKNRTEAEEEAKRLRREVGATGRAFGALREGERAALEAWRIFEEEAEKAGAPPPALLDVVRQFSDRWRRDRSGKSVADAVDAYILEKQNEELSPKHLATLKERLGRFAADFPGRSVSSLTTAEISAWLLELRNLRVHVADESKRPPLSAQTRRHYRTAVHSFFNFAEARRWVDTNPAKHAARPKVRPTLPGVMEPEAVALWLRVVAEREPRTLAFWSVAFFAGIRRAEIHRMRWEMIDLAAGEIHLPGSITKNGRPRTVKIEPNLAAWLRRLAQPSGPLAPSRDIVDAARKRVITEIRRRSGGQPFEMPHNAARHSYATAHLICYREPGETSMQLGHGQSPELLHARYRGAMTRAQAEAYWQIYPEAEPGNVVTLAQGAKPGTSKPRPKPATKSKRRRRA